MVLLKQGMGHLLFHQICRCRESAHWAFILDTAVMRYVLDPSLLYKFESRAKQRGVVLCTKISHAKNN